MESWKELPGASWHARTGSLILLGCPNPWPRELGKSGGNNTWTALGMDAVGFRRPAQTENVLSHGLRDVNITDARIRV